MTKASIGVLDGLPVPAAPVDERGRRLIGIRGLVEWAFQAECAGLDFDEIGALADGRAGVGTEYVIMQQLMLGCAPGVGVKVDTSIGRSYPAEDAETVASMLRKAVDWPMAVRVAELARTGRTPDWMPDARPRVEPRGWRACKHGVYAETERCGVDVYVYRGRTRTCERRWCPVVHRDTAREVLAARSAYLDWWNALLALRTALARVELRRFALTLAMPPERPWAKRHLTGMSLS